MNNADLLAISFLISQLTYSIGALIMMLPIPVSGLKKWGPKLIIDGIYGVILVLSFSLIITLVSLIGNYIGTNWSSFFKWQEFITSEMISLYLGIKTIIGISSSVPYISPIVSALFFVITSSLTLFLTFFRSVVALSLIVYNSYSLLLLLGILFITLPFRIGRSVGAGLIGFSIIFYIGLPLMPYFVQSLYPELPSITQNINSSNDTQVFIFFSNTILPSFAVYTVFLPATYLGILLSLSYGVSRAIGGGFASIPFPVGDIV